MVDAEQIRSGAMSGTQSSEGPLVAGRDAFGEALLELGEEDPRIVVLTADLSEALRVHHFARRFPERFFQMGIAEQDMVGTAAGLAMSGLIPFVTTFAVFATGRAHEQVRMAVCYNRANVKIAASHGGLVVGEDGATHQGLEDVALMRALPHMTVVVPADAIETRKAVRAAAYHQGPVYLRLGRIPTPVLTTEDTPFELGQAVMLREGDDVTIVGSGPILAEAMRAAAELAQDGVQCRVLNMHTVKPLDEKALEKAARETGALVTVEDHSVIGGLGGAVAEWAVRHVPVPVEMVGTPDVFGESGRPQELLEKYGLTAPAIKEAVLRVLRRKEEGRRR